MIVDGGLATIPLTVLFVYTYWFPGGNYMWLGLQKQGISTQITQVQEVVCFLVCAYDIYVL